jgi:hypothetical protein
MKKDMQILNIRLFQLTRRDLKMLNTAANYVVNTVSQAYFALHKTLKIVEILRKKYLSDVDVKL